MLDIADKVMEQAQVFASAWSMVGGVFDSGDGMENAEREKKDLREMVENVLQENARLREQLAAAEKAANDQSLLAEQYRIDAEAAEAKLKAASEQEPDIYVHNDGVEVWGAAANPELATNSSYSPYWGKPVPADVQGYNLAIRRIVDGMLCEAVHAHEDRAFVLRDVANALSRLIPIRPAEQLELLTEAHQRIAKLERKLAEQQAKLRMLSMLVCRIDAISPEGRSAKSELCRTLSPLDMEEELNTLLAKAREEGRLSAVPEGWKVVPKSLYDKMITTLKDCERGNYTMREAWGMLLAAAPNPEPTCNPHPDAPHGFDRNASHQQGRYVCECEGWTPGEKE